MTVKADLEGASKLNEEVVHVLLVPTLVIMLSVPPHASMILQDVLYDH